MEEITYEQYLQENIGIIPLAECLEVINAAKKGKLSALEVEEQLTPVLGTIFSKLFTNDKAKFDMLLSSIKAACEDLKKQEGYGTFALIPGGKGSRKEKL